MLLVLAIACRLTSQYHFMDLTCIHLIILHIQHSRHTSWSSNEYAVYNKTSNSICILQDHLVIYFQLFSSFVPTTCFDLWIFVFVYWTSSTNPHKYILHGNWSIPFLTWLMTSQFLLATLSVCLMILKLGLPLVVTLDCWLSKYWQWKGRSRTLLGPLLLLTEISWISIGIGINALISNYKCLK